MSCKVYIATSLDGFIAREDGSIDWLTSQPNPGNSDFGFADFMATVDAVVMGRKTFETVLGFGGTWPYAKPVFVLSHSLQLLPSHLEGRAELLKGSPELVLQQLLQKGYSSLYIDGGQTISAFLAAGLVDELTITRIPILLGRGIPLFALPFPEIPLEHIHTEVLNGVMVKSRYRKAEG